MLSQKWVTLIIAVVAAAILGGEYTFVHWYPSHKQREVDEALTLLPYQNAGLGVQMQIAAGIYGKVQDFAGGVKVYRPRFRGQMPSITMTSQPNPDGSSKFPDQYIAQLETSAENNGPSFEPVTLNGRAAVMITQLDAKSKTTEVIARIVAPDRIIQAVCDTGTGNLQVLTQACNESLDTIKVSGPPSKLPKAIYNIEN